MRRLGLLAALALGVPFVLFIASSGAGADVRCESSILDPQTGAVKCVVLEIHSHGPGDPDPNPTQPDLEARWNAFHCDEQAPFQPGYIVTLTVVNQIPPENYDIINADPSAPGYRFLEDGIDYYNVLVHCGYPGAPPGGVFQILSGPELNPGPDPLALRAEALAKITVPEPPVSSNPPHDQPDRFGLVNIPTWFWLDAGYWTPQSASATDPTGAVTVSVTATPLHADWDPGDGSAPIRCLDAGLEWNRGMAEDASDCSHMYTRSSAGRPGDDYSLEVAVEWEYSWAINGTPQGPFGTTNVATPFDYAVGEIQAVGS